MPGRKMFGEEALKSSGSFGAGLVFGEFRAGPVIEVARPSDPGVLEGAGPGPQLSRTGFSQHDEI